MLGIDAGQDVVGIVRARDEHGPVAEQQEADPAGRQPAGLGHRHPGDLVDLERRTDLVGQLVDEVQLPIAVERLARERPLSVSREQAYDRTDATAPAGRGPSTQPTVSPSTVMGWWPLGASDGAAPTGDRG